MTAKSTHRAAALELARRDPVLAAMLGAVGPPVLGPPHGTHFEALVRSVLYQQLAGAAAAAIHTRLSAALRGDITPGALIALGEPRLRAVGLSANKAASLVDLSGKVLEGAVDLDPGGLARAPDEEVIARLSTVRGIGRWTAQMFLLFQLRRLDVWPAGDLGVRRGYGLAWRVPMPDERELGSLGERFSPFRSVAAWYCWRACELYGGARQSAVTA